MLVSVERIQQASQMDSSDFTVVLRQVPDISAISKLQLQGLRIKGQAPNRITMNPLETSTKAIMRHCITCMQKQRYADWRRCRGNTQCRRPVQNALPVQWSLLIGNERHSWCRYSGHITVLQRPFIQVSFAVFCCRSCANLQAP